MSIMDFFASQGTASPSPDSERGDWMDWYLNREGPAGRFRGSRRPRYGIDYLFNGGGSVQSGPRRSVQSGPKTREKLQPRSVDVLGNVSDRYYREGNVEGMERIGQEMRNRLKNNPGLQPGTGYLFPNTQEPWNNPGPGSYWNAGLQSGNNTGIMNAVADYSPNARGRWLTQSPKGNKLLSFLVNKFGSEGSSEYLEDILGSGGISAFGGTLSPTWGDNGWGLTGTWEL